MAQLRFFCSKENLDALMQTYGIRDPEYIGTIFEDLDVTGYGENGELVSFVLVGDMGSAKALVQRLDGAYF